jgi:hypothetical protein
MKIQIKIKKNTRAGGMWSRDNKYYKTFTHYKIESITTAIALKHIEIYVV